MQNHYNLIYREEEREMNPLCIDQGVGLIPWSPLARGFLEGDRKQERGEGRPSARRPIRCRRKCTSALATIEVAVAAQRVAKAHGVTPTQIALAWILQAPGVTAPIIGATKRIT